MRSLKRIFFNIIKFKPVNYFLLLVLEPLSKRFPKLHKAASRIPVNKVFKSKTEEGYEFRMYSDGTDNIAKKVFWEGIASYEANTMSIFKHFINNSDIFFDIGANTGVYSLYAAAINKKIEIHSFEPINMIFRYLERNKSINDFKKMHVINVALSDTAGDLTFHIPFDSISHVPTGASIHSEHLKNMKVIKNKVKATTLDKYCSDNNVKKIDLIKIDTEGTEDLVFKGGFNILLISKPAIICEVWPGEMGLKIKNILDKLNYKYLLLTENGLKKEEDIEGVLSSDYFNHLFVQDHHINHMQKNSFLFN